MVFNFIHLDSIGELFSPSVYQKSRRLKNEYGFCSVVFDKEQKTYYYLTDKDDIAIGDEMIVPVGATNRETIAKVVGIEYYNKEETPIAVEKIKWIIRKK